MFLRANRNYIPNVPFPKSILKRWEKEVKEIKLFQTNVFRVSVKKNNK